MITFFGRAMDRRSLVLAVLAGSYLVKMIYLLNFTSYLTSFNIEMGFNWGAAKHLASGNGQVPWLYAIAPTFYIYFLSSVMKLMHLAGLFSSTLLFMIHLHLLLFSISAYFIYRVCEKLLVNPWLSFLAFLSYVFSYIPAQMSALMIGENIATPLVMIGVSLVILRPRTQRLLWWTGILMGIAICSKPVYLFSLLAFVITLLSTKTPGLTKIALSAAFMAGASLIILSVVFLNYSNSEGKLIGLGANGGANFFQGWGQPHKVISDSKEGYFWVLNPTVSVHADWGWKPFYTKHPLSDQSFFYAKALENIKNNPGIFVEKIGWFKYIFTGPLSPMINPKPPFYEKMLSLDTFIMMFMSCFLLLFWPVLLRDAQRPYFLFLFLNCLLILFSVYVMAFPERKHLYFVESFILILFFATVDRLRMFVRVFGRVYFRQWATYTACVLVLSGLALDIFILSRRYCGLMIFYS